MPCCGSPELIDSGTLVPNGSGLLRFAEDTRFDSPSTAASVIAGGNINGRVNWKRNAKSLKALKEAGLV